MGAFGACQPGVVVEFPTNIVYRQLGANLEL